MRIEQPACLFHAVIFSLQQAIQETRAEESIIISSHAAKFLKEYQQCLGHDIFAGKSLGDDCARLTEWISRQGAFAEAEFVRAGDDEHEFIMEGCSMAKAGVHKGMRPVNNVCPMAMVAAALFKSHHPDADIIIEPSQFSASGSRSRIHCIELPLSS